MRLAFLLTPEETFTPKLSGAIATHAHACCLEARAAGHETLVIARPHEQAEPYEDVELITFAYPATPQGGLPLLLRRAERKLRHYTRLCYGAYLQHMMQTLQKHSLTEATLIVHNDPELIVALRSCFPRTRLIHWFHNQHRCKPRARAAFKRCADASIAVSDFILGWVIEYYGVPESSVHRIYNGVDVDAFRPRLVNGSIGNGHLPVINFTGRTGIEKGPDVLLAAALQLAQRGTTSGFAVQVIGANHWGARTMDRYQQALDDLASEIRSFGIEVQMHGHLDREATAMTMQQADIHVVPGRWDEPFGLTTVEGMACGLATVGSRTGATPEILADDGLLFEREDVAGLAGHLERLVTDHDVRVSFGERARRRAGEFTWRQTWSGLERVLERLA